MSFKSFLIENEKDYEQALSVRRDVFVVEQGVPESLEIDEYEKVSHHFLCRDETGPVGAGRLRQKKSFAKFERIATLKSFRGQGAATSLMKEMQNFAREKYPRLLRLMHAQKDAIGFYEKLGWVGIGRFFEEAGIEHRVLICPPEKQALSDSLLLWSDNSVSNEIKEFLKK